MTDIICNIAAVIFLIFVVGFAVMVTGAIFIDVKEQISERKHNKDNRR